MTEPTCGFDLDSEPAFDNCFERPICGPSVANEYPCRVMRARRESEGRNKRTGSETLNKAPAEISFTRVAPASIPGLTRRGRTEAVQQVASQQPQPAQASAAQTRDLPGRSEKEQAAERIRSVQAMVDEVEQGGSTQSAPAGGSIWSATSDASQGAPLETTRPSPTRPAAKPEASPKQTTVNTIPVTRDRKREQPVSREAAPQVEINRSAVQTEPVKPKWEITGLEPVQDSILEIDGETWAWENGLSCSKGA